MIKIMGKRAVTLTVLMFVVTLFQAADSVIAQEEDEVIDIGTVEIRVDPETPNVITTVDRQKPDIDIGELRRPNEGKIFNTSSSIKPRMADIEVKKVKKPEKKLAKTRKH